MPSMQGLAAEMLALVLLAGCTGEDGLCAGCLWMKRQREP